ncbi:MAG: aminotransferase class V-fold PLP-dependent enzyme, partial [Alphaproteobacteria bacterium]|nr:aminotransferase class V-fold PLP-dependent enzyme [Alphaproteobacteria bacterium]
MSGERIYLDHNASAPLHAAAREAIAAALALTGNASSVHAEGRRVRGLIENARAQVAGLAGVSAAAVVFTSSGTEAANLALRPALFAGLVTAGRPLLLMGAGEHVCVREGHSFDGGDTCDVRLTGDGVLDLGALADAINRAQGRTCILALQAANNETGAVQPVAEASALVRAAGGFVICDSVQAAGRMDCRELAKHSDVLIFSAHKIGGPQGAGALIA